MCAPGRATRPWQGTEQGMSSRTRRALATVPLLCVVAAGCSADESPTATDDESSTATESPAEGTEDSAPTETADTTETADPQGPATFDTLTGEATRLTLDQRYVDTLSTLGAELTAVGGAQTETTGESTTFVFPVTGGQATVDASAADPFTGTVEHEGGLQLSALGRSVTLDGLVLDGGQDQLTAMVAGRRVPLLPLSMSDARITSSEDSVVVQDSAVSLDSTTASELARQVGLPLTLPDVDVGSLEATLTGS